MTLPIAYFPPISWFLHLLHENAEIEAHENYVKQTLRNRCQIATACGVQNLSVPIVRKSENSERSFNPRLITNILISPHDNWNIKHWHAIETAYGESAFFDYYADDLKPCFIISESLFNHNVRIIRKLLELMDIDHELHFTDHFKGNTNFCKETTNTPNAPSIPVYYQVFREKLGFIPDLSILDLLFNLGPESACYLLKPSLFSSLLQTK